MKSKKRITCILLIAALVFSATGCSKKEWDCGCTPKQKKFMNHRTR